jgi:hypothetical protein
MNPDADITPELVEDVKHRSRLVWQTGLHAGVQFVRDAAHAQAVGSASGVH